MKPQAYDSSLFSINNSIKQPRHQLSIRSKDSLAIKTFFSITSNYDPVVTGYSVAQSNFNREEDVILSETDTELEVYVHQNTFH
jgi:hypothetical protein